MKKYLDPIFSASTIEGVCAALQSGLDSLRAEDYLAELPDYYENISARTAIEIQEWFDEMRDDDQATEEGNLKEIFDLFDAALRQLRKCGFHRNTS